MTKVFTMNGERNTEGNLRYNWAWLEKELIQLTSRSLLASLTPDVPVSDAHNLRVAKLERIEAMPRSEASLANRG
jgi:hypothetical protein